MGPAVYNRHTQRLDVQPVVQAQAMEGWRRDRRTGQLVSRLAPDSDTIDRVIPFYLDEAPQGGRQPAAPEDNPGLMVWSDRQYSTAEASLHSELRINGNLINVFTSDSRKQIGRHLKKGENTITLRTVPRETASELNDLTFTIGPVVTDEAGEPLMQPLWRFRNGTGWKIQEGRHVHGLGPDVNEVTLSFRLHFAGPEHEGDKLKEGDFVLQASPQYSTSNTSVTATVFVNGTPLNSFTMLSRRNVITPLLKQGRNELRIISRRVSNILEDKDLRFEVSGPAAYAVASL